MKKLSALGVVLSLSCALAAPAFCAEAAPAADALFEKKCGSCHSADRAKGKKKTAEEWEATVKRMKAHGAALSEDETKGVVDFLAKTYGK